MSIAEILRTYSSIKGHCTRIEREIQSLLDMLKVQYSAPSEVRVNDRLEKLEKYTHRLSDISDYLITAKYPKAADHVNDCLLYTSPSPRDGLLSRMPSSA